MTSYSAADLFRLGGGVQHRPPDRATRKRLFTLHLWCPLRFRLNRAVHLFSCAAATVTGVVTEPVAVQPIS